MEDGALGILAPPLDLEESASHNFHDFPRMFRYYNGSRRNQEMGLIPSERASKIIIIHVENLSFDGLEPEISLVKGGPGT